MKKGLMLFTAMTSFFVGSSVANAASGKVVEVDSNYTVDVSIKNRKVNMTLNDVDSDNNVSYYMYIYDGDNKPALISDDDCYHISNVVGFTQDYSKFYNYSKTSNSFTIDDSWYLKNGYTNAVIMKKTSNGSDETCEVQKNPVKLERPSLPGINERYEVTASSNNADFLGLAVNYPGSTMYEYDVKIGIVKDNNVLKAYAKKDLNGYNALNSYAKSDSGIVTNQVTWPNTTTNLGFELTEGAYYYIYVTTKLDNTFNNLDYVVISKVVNKVLVINPSLEDFIDDNNTSTDVTPTATIIDNEPEPEPEKVPEKTVENPNTAIKNTLMIAPMVALLIASIVALRRSKSLFHRI